MPAYFSNELAGSANQTAIPVGFKPSATLGYGSRVRRYSGSFTLASQTTSDTLIVANIPAGADFAFGVITSSVSLGTSTISIGVAGTPALYRAAATFTAVDTPTTFGPAAQVRPAALTAEQTVIVTIATASLPASGTLVIDLYFANV